MGSEEAEGTASSALVLRDEEGREFVFHPVRSIRDGADLFLLAEREGEGTLHVLAREGDAIGLVRDLQALRRVAARLEILRRAMEGELVEWHAEDGVRAFGVFHRGAIAGRPYLLAADLADPATVLAFEPTAEGLRPLDDRLTVLVREQLEEPARAAEVMGPHLESLALGLRGERVAVRDAAGQEATYETAGRLSFQGRDLLFLKDPADAGRAFPVEVGEGGALEAIPHEAELLDALDAQLSAVRAGGGAA